MIEKKFLAPEEIGELLTHWPEIDPEKIALYMDRGLATRRFQIPGKATRAEAQVLAVTPILICDAETISNASFILNGKHRSAVALLNNMYIESVRVSSIKDLLYHASTDWFGGKDAEEVTTLYENRKFYEDYCAQQGASTMNDLIRTNVRLIEEVLGRKIST